MRPSLTWAHACSYQRAIAWRSVESLMTQRGSLDQLTSSLGESYSFDIKLW
jgi:hypothetical protein